MQHHPVVSRDEWLIARTALLAREKEATHQRDELNAARRALPWVAVDKGYVFDTPAGKRTLAELFEGRSQLTIYHFMFGPDWQAGCPGCSFLADHIDGALAHLNHHDVTMVAVSRAPLDKIQAYKTRMGWHFPWVSSFGTDFNFDYGVSYTKEALAAGKVFHNYEMIDAARANDELPGLSAFARDEAGRVFHTYSTFGRGPEELIGTMMILDRAPRGRDEREGGNLGNWVKRHDEYEGAAASSCRGS